MNYYTFYGDSSTTAGEIEYDHIVPVLGFDSFYNDDLYHPDDVIYFSDNGSTACIGAADMTVCDDKTPQYTYEYTVSSFIGTRAQANSITGSVYRLPKNNAYGIAHLGLIDPDG